MVINMKEDHPQDDGQVDRIRTLNITFEDLIADASDLVKDLYWGVETHLFFGGLISLLRARHVGCGYKAVVTFTTDSLTTRSLATTKDHFPFVRAPFFLH